MSQNSVYNKLITKEDIQLILSPYLPQIKINDVQVFQQAMVHSSFVAHQCNVGTFRATESYDLLEFRGDALIFDIATDYLMMRFPDMKESRLSQLRVGIIRGETLASLARRLGLIPFVLVAQSIDDVSKEILGNRVSRQSDDVLEDVFEAFVAALLKDQGGMLHGMPNVYNFMVNLWNKTLNIEKLLQDDQNPKGTLCSYCISRKWNTPVLLYLTSSSSAKVPDGHSPSSKVHNSQQTISTKRTKNVSGYVIAMKRLQVEKTLDKLGQLALEDKINEEFDLSASDDWNPEEDMAVSLSICYHQSRKKIAMNEAYTLAMRRFESMAHL